MAYEDRLLGPVFPVRAGESSGAANERRMLERFADTGSFRSAKREDLSGDTITLRTRGGHPEFVREEVESTTDQALRGFGAAARYASTAVLFVPTGVAVVEPQYRPPKVSWHVRPKATSVNADAAGITQWFDVLSWDDGPILVNGAVLAELSAMAVHLPQGQPYTIPANESSVDATHYGVGRTHIVTRSAVHALAADNSIARVAVVPETPMTDRRAYLGGQRIDADHIAYFMQLASLSSDWRTDGLWNIITATVQMTPGAATRTSSLMASTACNSPFPGAGVNSDFATTESADIPGTFLYWRCVPSINRTVGAPVVQIYVNYRSTNQEVIGASVGICEWNNHTTTRSGEASGSDTIGPHAVSWTASCASVAGTHYGYNRRAAMTHEIESHHGWGYTSSTYTAIGSQNDGWFTSDGFGHSLPYNSSGTTGFYTAQTSIPGPQPQKTTQQYSASASMAVDGRQVTLVTVSHTSEQGKRVVYSVLDKANANDGALIANGRVEAYQPLFFGPPPQDWIDWRNNVIVVESAALGEGLSAYFDLTVIDMNGTGVLASHTAEAVDYTNQTSTIAWNTRDFWYYDVDQQLFLSIDAQFSGSESSSGGQTTCTLTVTLTIEFRGQSTQQPLFSGAIEMSNLLPTISSVDGPYVPAPLLRTHFMPRFRQQGVFRGVAHTTMAEEASGADPHCLMSFALRLSDYDGVSENGNEEIDNRVTVVPGLLLEMLYAYVYSHRYGLDPDVAYPIDRSEVYNQLKRDLFAPTWSINYHNGTMELWKNAVDPAFQSVTEVEVFRV